MNGLGKWNIGLKWGQDLQNYRLPLCDAGNFKIKSFYG